MKTELEILTKKGVSFEEIEKCIQFFAEDRCEGINLSNNSPLFFVKDLLIIASKLLNGAYNSCIDNINIETANGNWLANAGFISTGLLPYEASKTTVSALLLGKNGTLLRRGFVIKSPEKEDFFLTQDTLISNDNVYEAELVQTENSFVFWLHFEGITHKLEGSNFEDFATQSNYNTDLTHFCAFDVKDGNLTIRAIFQSFKIDGGSGVLLSKIKTPAVFASSKYGAISFFSSKGVFEKKEGLEDILIGNVLLGREAEDDLSYKQRVFKERESLGIGNSRFVESFKKANPNITYFTVFQNDTDVSIRGKEGTLRRSIECVVEGGDAYSIAKAIWDFKGQGVGTYGREAVNIKDEFGKTHKVFYSRPETLICTLTLNLLPYKPIDLQIAKEKVVKTIMFFVQKNNKIGQNFSLGRLAAFVTENIKELENTNISAEVQKMEQKPDFIPTNKTIKIEYDQILIFSETKIEVQITSAKMIKENDTL